MEQCQREVSVQPVDFSEYFDMLLLSLLFFIISMFVRRNSSPRLFALWVFVGMQRKVNFSVLSCAIIKTLGLYELLNYRLYEAWPAIFIFIFVRIIFKKALRKNVKAKKKIIRVKFFLALFFEVLSIKLGPFFLDTIIAYLLFNMIWLVISII
jgi:hypothetical protein